MPTVAAYSKNTNNGQLLVKLHSLPNGGVVKKLMIYDVVTGTALRCRILP